MMKLSHEIFLALAHASQVSDPDAVRSRFVASLNGLDGAFSFEFFEHLPPGIQQYRVMPIETLRSSFGYAVMAENPETSEAEQAVFRTAFQFLAVILENRIQTQALESRNASLLKEITLEKSPFHTVLNTLPVGVWVADEKGTILMGNAAGKKIWAGIRYVGIDQYGQYNAWWADTGERIGPEDWSVARAIRTGETALNEEVNIECFDGSHKTILVSAAPLLDHERKIIGAVAINQDITERKQAEEALFREKALLDTLFDAPHDTVFLFESRTGKPLRWNRRFVQISGYDDKEIAGMKAPDDFYDKDDLEKAKEMIIALLSEKHGTLEISLITKQGIRIPFEYSASAITAPDGKALILSIGRDMTERKRVEKEKATLQEQLLQAQKIESVGRLAGGVAHDFNNMLGVILGHAELAMEQVDPTQPLYADLMEIWNAAERSSDLTRQLLAFARKQTVSPKVLDLNETVEGMLKMLRRLIGEDIHLAWLPGVNLWSVKVDPSQIDQILANLCVNARDAIAGVGKVTIETENSHVAEDYCNRYAGVIPGEYVLLAVSDNGCGMEKEVLGKLFEPFFTTKAVGQGTGLGLATIYGIVQQNKGFVNVYSEPDQGTTFRIYLPRHAGKVEQPRTEALGEPLMRGQETVLVVEDEPAILKLSRLILEKQGYRVLTAGTPGEAIDLADAYADEIHLLITDVVMPEMNGRDLAKKMFALHPNLKCLFMSGYTANVIAHHGVLDEGVQFIQKPFSRKTLTAKVREALDQSQTHESLGT